MVLADHPRQNSMEDEKVNIIRTLAVKGSLDILAKGFANSISKQITVEHPNDKGYFKKVYVLSNTGKRLLKQKKYK